MLVVSRKVGERVLVGDTVVVTVVRVGPNAVRLGIEAPKSMNIVREELVAQAAEPDGGVTSGVLGGMVHLKGIEVVTDEVELARVGDFVEV